MALMIYDDKLLIVDGKLALGEDCCCASPSPSPSPSPSLSASPWPSVSSSPSPSWDGPSIDPGSYYCVYIEEWTVEDPDTFCEGPPDVTLYSCIGGGALIDAGGWQNCYSLWEGLPKPWPPGAVWLMYWYVSGPYATFALCESAGCAAP